MGISCGCEFPRLCSEAASTHLDHAPPTPATRTQCRTPLHHGNWPPATQVKTLETDIIPPLLSWNRYPVPVTTTQGTHLDSVLLTLTASPNHFPRAFPLLFCSSPHPSSPAPQSGEDATLP